MYVQKLAALAFEYQRIDIPPKKLSIGNFCTHIKNGYFFNIEPLITFYTAQVSSASRVASRISAKGSDVIEG